MAKSAKRRVGRPPGRKAPRRPVVSARVPESLYAEIKKAADEAGRTMGEELVWRADKAGEWARAFGNQQKMLAKTKADLDAIERGSTAAALYRLGWRKIIGTPYSISGTVWVEAGDHDLPESGFVDPETNKVVGTEQRLSAVPARLIENIVTLTLQRAGVIREDKS